MKLSPKDTAEDTAIKTNIKIYNTILKRNLMQAIIIYINLINIKPI